MDYRKKYEEWTTDTFFDEGTRKELAAITDEKEIEDRFYRDLRFGTGGLRGVMGAGTNRMNRYTVGKATAGLGKYLTDTYGEEDSRKRGVVIAYDTRYNSDLFARTAADILSGMGIHVYLHETPCPTPQLSFAVRFLHAAAGIVITASHNPKEYNGYKVYDEFGCQLVPSQAKQVISYIDQITDYRIIQFMGNASLISMVDVTDDFALSVIKQSRYKESGAKKKLKIVYTPLHGTGNIPVRKVLGMDGFSQVAIVEEQAVADGGFPTVISPNPEDSRALEEGISKAENLDSDIVLGTDPDCDRVGVAVKAADGTYHLLTGNQVGALLMKFVLDHTDMSVWKRPAVIKTIVTSDLGAEIARGKNLSVFSTLTGFKYIGEKITQFEQAKKNGNTEQDYDFVLGYEESYGYLAGTHARDKDAVVSSLLICEMAAEAKAEGKTLLDRLDDIYRQYGYYQEALDSYTLKGKDGAEKITAIMNELRGGKTPFDADMDRMIDYSNPVEAEPGFGFLPLENVLKFILKDGSWAAVRPSGTEPKIKIYYSVRGSEQKDAEKRMKNLRQSMKKIIDFNTCLLYTSPSPRD